MSYRTALFVLVVILLPGCGELKIVNTVTDYRGYGRGYQGSGEYIYDPRTGTQWRDMGPESWREQNQRARERSGTNRRNDHRRNDRRCC
ncbi:hypothetical protein K2X96_02335 [Patescibacteria group bacterium]|nr:hypothetical protein [Patescibacteria group bacterium]